jgi:hypothetical protein
MESLPAELKGSLPSPEAIEAELESQDRRVREGARRDKSTGDTEARANLALRIPAGI